jgi:hypothetical protein
MRVEILETDTAIPNMASRYMLWGLNGKDIGRRLITKGGEFVADVSKYYELLPNERAVEVADKVASELGAVPFNEFRDDLWFVRMNEHVIQCGHKVHALYAWDKPVDLGGGDTIQLGFAVHNSIDGSMGFSVGLFTFRHACINMVWMGFKGRGMKFDGRNVLASYYRVHVKGLEVDENELKAKIEDVIDRGLEVAETYRRWKTENIKKKQALRLRGLLPKSVLPTWLQPLPDEVKVPRAMKIWEVYNDITAAIWHNAETQDTTKQQHFNNLHKVLMPALGVQ